MSDELEDMIVDAELYPPWKEALVKFRAAGFKADEIVAHRWFYEALDLDEPKPGMTWERVEKTRLRFLGQFKALQKALLEQDMIDLVNEPGMGYRIMPSDQQAKRAYNDGVKGIKKAVRNMVDRASNTNMALLSADQRREHADMLARMGQLGGMLKGVRALPSREEE